MSDLQKELLALKAAAETMPGPEDIESVLALVAKGSPFDQLFFEKLNDSAWLPVLSRCGYFSNLPTTKKEAGREVYPFHLPLMGLTRLAEMAPHAVMSILANLEIPENPTVGDQILRCATLIREPTCIPLLHSLLARLGEKSNRSSWFWIQELIKNWMALKAYPDVLIAINSYLNAELGLFANPSPTRDQWLVRQIDEIALEFLTHDYPLEVATIVFNALSGWANQKNSEGSGQKPSYGIEFYLGDERPFSYWLEDFKTDPNHREFEGTLARRLFIAAEQIYKNGDSKKIEALDQLLRSNSWTLFQRLRWQLYADFPEIGFENARHDVLERVRYMNRAVFSHNYEFARLLQIFAKQKKDAFLSSAEVVQIFNVILEGPFDESGAPIEDGFREIFRRKQLWPISPLLSGEQLATYQLLAPNSDKIDIESYKPFRSSGGLYPVEHIPPPQVENLASMPNEEVLAFLRDWKPSGERISRDGVVLIEDIGPLIIRFAEIVESDPKRFPPETKWWENFRRPELLIKPLEKASERISKKDQNITDNLWASWFGIAHWIIVCSKSEKEAKSDEKKIFSDWHWPRMVVTNFLTAVIQSENPAVNNYLIKTGEILKSLAEEEDSGLKEIKETRSSDWFGIAINSVRGNSIGGLLKLALKQKNANEKIAPWIFEFILSRLNLPEESPAIFALIGANLRLFVYLFEEQIKLVSAVLLPQERPAHKRALVVAHVCFDHPMTGVIKVFPGFLNDALSIFESHLEETKDEDPKRNHRDFASQLGVHIAFYYWNSAFPNDAEGEAALDRFFNLAHKETRAHLIHQIAWIFERSPATKEGENIIRKTMHLWERRFEQIDKNLQINEALFSEFEGELGQFMDWLGCECFPFEWRSLYAMKAIHFLKKMPDSFRLLEVIYKWDTTNPERLGSALQILKAIIERPNDQLRWTLRAQKLGPLITRGLTHDNPEIKNSASAVRDLFLTMGMFDFLEIEKT